MRESAWRGGWRRWLLEDDGDGDGGASHHFWLG